MWRIDYMATKLDHTERKKLVGTIRDVLATIEGIEDTELQTKLSVQNIKLRDQKKNKCIFEK